MGGHCRYLKTDPGHLGTEGTYGPHHQPTDQHTAAPASNHKRRAFCWLREHLAHVGQ